LECHGCSPRRLAGSWRCCTTARNSPASTHSFVRQWSYTSPTWFATPSGTPIEATSPSNVQDDSGGEWRAAPRSGAPCSRAPKVLGSWARAHAVHTGCWPFATPPWDPNDRNCRMRRWRRPTFSISRFLPTLCLAALVLVVEGEGSTVYRRAGANSTEGRR
jgi:hypothetical protein